MLDETHDPLLRSWVEDANGHPEFPIQNLPLGVFRPRGGDAQGGIAVGEHILSLRAVAERGLVQGDALAACRAVAGESLNELLGMGARYRRALRRAVSGLLAHGGTERWELLHTAAECEVLLPVCVGDYTDFYAGIVHAENVGKVFRPENPLLPNYKWVPIGYHGRASSVRVSGEAVQRPWGQRKNADAGVPTFGPTQKLDFELELGIWVGPGNGPGERIAIGDAAEHIAGYCLLNDWSARDVQSWEYQPLGPFLGKSFHTTASGWMVTPEALAPFRRAQKRRADGDPLPLEYLASEDDQATGALDVELEVWLRRAGGTLQRLSQSHAEWLYWTPAQLVTHHASNGCNLRAGDLLGTGTISAPEGAGSLLEMGVEFLQNGDEVVLRGRARREGFVGIGFGECSGVISSGREREQPTQAA